MLARSGSIEKSTVEKPSTVSRRRRVTIQTDDIDEGHANENDEIIEEPKKKAPLVVAAAAAAKKTSKEALTTTKQTITTSGGIRKEKARITNLPKKSPTPTPTIISSQTQLKQKKKELLSSKLAPATAHKSPAKNARLRAQILKNAQIYNSDDDGDVEDLGGDDPFAFAEDA